MKFEITEGAPVDISEHPLPVYLPGNALRIGKATVVEGINDAAVIIEIDLDPSILPSLIKAGLVSFGFEYASATPLTKEENTNASIKEVQTEAHPSPHQRASS